MPPSIWTPPASSCIRFPMPLSMAPSSVIIMAGCTRAKTDSGVSLASSSPTNPLSSSYRSEMGRSSPRMALMTSSKSWALSRPSIMFVTICWPICSPAAAPCCSAPARAACRSCGMAAPAPPAPGGGAIGGAATGAAAIGRGVPPP